MATHPQNLMHTDVEIQSTHLQARAITKLENENSKRETKRTKWDEAPKEMTTQPSLSSIYIELFYFPNLPLNT
jgi:hypothetical protein